MRLKIAVVSLALIICTAAAFPQAKTLTLSDAIGIALQRNLSVAQAQNNVDAAQSGVLAAWGGYLPTLTATAGASRNRYERPGSSPVIVNGIPLSPGTSGLSINNSFSTGLNLNYTIFDGFSREGTFNRATSSATATEQTAERTRQSVVYQVQSAYVTVLKNEQLVGVNDENLKRDQKQLERIVESNKVGSLSLADVYRQQSQVAADEYALISAQNTFDKSKADLLSLVGVDISDEYLIVDTTISPDMSQSFLDSTKAAYNNFDDLARRALVARPDYQSARELLSADESGVTEARSNYFPSLSAFAGYGLQNQELNRISDNKSLSWGLNFNWRLFDGFNTNYQVQSAIATRRNAEVNVAQTERNIGVEVKKALLDLDAARKQYDVSMKAVVSASEDRKIADEKYNLGAGTLLDLLVANANLVNAEANKINAAYGYIVAKLNMEYVVGERSY